jgi:hypothetical protein
MGYNYYDEYQKQHMGGKPYGGANVTFKENSCIHDQKSALAGHPVYHTVITICIKYPGEAPIELAAEDKHKQHYPAEWAAFLAGQEAPVDGMPITEWAMLTKADADNLKQLGFKTVEQVAQASGEAMRKMRSLSVFVPKAQKYIANLNSSSVRISGLEAQLAAMTDKCIAYETQVHELLLQIDSLQGSDRAKSFVFKRTEPFKPQVVAAETQAVVNKIEAPKRGRGRAKKIVAPAETSGVEA